QVHERYCCRCAPALPPQQPDSCPKYEYPARRLYSKLSRSSSDLSIAQIHNRCAAVCGIDGYNSRTNTTRGNSCERWCITNIDLGPEYGGSAGAADRSQTKTPCNLPHDCGGLPDHLLGQRARTQRGSRLCPDRRTGAEFSVLAADRALQSGWRQRQNHSGTWDGRLNQKRRCCDQTALMNILCSFE